MTFGNEHPLSSLAGLRLLSYRPTSVFVSTGASPLLACLPATDRWFPGYLLLRQKKGRNLTFFSLAIVRAPSSSAPPEALSYGPSERAGFRGGLYWGPLAPAVSNPRLRTIQRAALGVALGSDSCFLFFRDSSFPRVAFYQEKLLPSSAPANSETELGYP